MNQIGIIYNKIINILANDIEELYTFDINNIIELEIPNIEILISSLLNHITTINNNIDNYKFIYFKPLYDFIFNIINISKLNNKNINISIELLEKTSCLYQGQIYLKKLKNDIINKYNHDDIIELIKKSSLYGTLPTFLFWIDIIKSKITDIIITDIFILSILNSDDRIYKYILNNFLKKEEFFSNSLNIQKILLNLLSSNSIPRKYKLRRLKNLSQYTNFKPYYEYMIHSTISSNIIIDITKYYYNYELSFDIIKKIQSLYDIANKTCYDQEHETIFDMLKTKKEKNIYAILYNLKSLSYNDKIIPQGSYYELLDEYYYKIIELISISVIYYNLIFIINPVSKNIINYLCSNKYFNKYLEISNNYFFEYKLYIYTKFFVPAENYNHNINYIIKVNKCLHYLRLFAKKIYKNKINKFKINFNPIINEIINYSPNERYKVLEYGSNNYKLKKQIFNTIPPRHLLPNELKIYSNFLLKEKADGILINTLPTNIYPICSEIQNYQIKAEYIEDLDLYLIFDINIPNTSIIDRYNILRKSHPYTCNSNNMITINNINELIDKISEERVILSKFIKENKNIKWYPKAAWKVNNINELFYSQILDFINEYDKNINNFILEKGIFICDGLILTPLNGYREIKIKPKSYLTIDLLYKNNKWLDRNNNDWSNIIINKNNLQNKIYRCYPIKDTILKYDPQDIRYDKKNPNTYDIIDTCKSIYLANWNNENKIYYKECKILSDLYLKKVLNNQEIFFINILKFINPELNHNWLDLGCGKCKFFKDIKLLFKPKKYIGIDIDSDYLAKALKYQDENSNIVELYSLNLNNNWNENGLWKTFNYTYKYDYIFANFSLMYFCSDIFWKELNKVVKKGSIFIFNLVKKNVEWKYNDSYLYTSEDTVYYNFEWLNNITRTEKLITNDLLKKYLLIYNWNIIDIKENISNDLSKIYIWYIIVKTI